MLNIDRESQPVTSPCDMLPPELILQVELIAHAADESMKRVRASEPLIVQPLSDLHQSGVDND